MKRFAYLVSLFILCPYPLAADQHGGNHTLSLNPGLTFPLSEIDFTAAGGGTSRVGSTGFSVGGQYLYNLSPRVSVGADLSYLAAGKERSSTVLPPAVTDVSFRSTIFMAILRANFATGKRVPFVLVGFGMHSTSLNIGLSPGPGLVWIDTGGRETRDMVNDTKQGVAAAIGLGFDYYFREPFFLGVEGRLQTIGRGSYQTTTFGADATGIRSLNGSWSAFNLLARAGYKFGGSEIMKVAKTAETVEKTPESSPASPTPPLGTRNGSEDLTSRQAPRGSHGLILSLLGGGAFPFSDMNVTTTSNRKEVSGNEGLSYGGQLLFPINRWFSLGADLLDTPLGRKTSPRLQASYLTAYDFTIFTALGMARAQVPLAEDIKVFLFGGLGVYRATLHMDERPKEGLWWADTLTSEARPLIDQSVTGFAKAVGGGVDVALTKRISLGAEARYEWVPSQTYDVNLAIAGTTLHGHINAAESFLALLLRTTYHF